MAWNKLRDYLHKNGLRAGELTHLMGGYGLEHTGRFAQEDQEVFGVLPSCEEKMSRSFD